MINNCNVGLYYLMSYGCGGDGGYSGSRNELQSTFCDYHYEWTVVMRVSSRASGSRTSQMFCNLRVIWAQNSGQIAEPHATKSFTSSKTSPDNSSSCWARALGPGTSRATCMQNKNFEQSLVSSSYYVTPRVFGATPGRLHQVIRRFSDPRRSLY